MQQPSVAARRFYHAVYRWNVLAATSCLHRQPRHVRALLLDSASRSFHASFTSQLGATTVSARRARGRGPIVRHQPESATPRTAPVLPEEKTTSPEKDAESPSVLIRNRPRRADSRKASGVAEEGESNRARSHRAKDKSRDGSVPRTQDSTETKTQLKRRGHNASPSSRASKLDAEVSPRMSSQSMANETRSWASEPAQQTPVHDLRPFVFTLRHGSKEDNSYGLEVVIPIRSWDRMIALMPVSQVRSYSGALLSVSDRFASEKHDANEDKLWKRSITIEGNMRQVGTVKTLFQGLFERVREQQRGEIPDEELPPLGHNESSALDHDQSPNRTSEQMPVPLKKLSVSAVERPVPVEQMSVPAKQIPAPAEQAPVTKWILMHPIPRSRYPTSSLRKGAYVLRRRTEDYQKVTLEVVFGENHWRRLTDIQNRESLQLTSGASIRAGDPFWGVDPLIKRKRDSKIGVIITGTVDQVRKARNLLQALQQQLRVERTVSDAAVDSELKEKKDNVPSTARSWRPIVQTVLKKVAVASRPSPEVVDAEGVQSIEPQSSEALAPRTVDERIIGSLEDKSKNPSRSLRTANSDLRAFAMLAVPDSALGYVLTRRTRVFRRGAGLVRKATEYPNLQPEFQEQEGNLVLIGESLPAVNKAAVRVRDLVVQVTHKDDFDNTQGMVLREGYNDENLAKPRKWIGEPLHEQVAASEGSGLSDGTKEENYEESEKAQSITSTSRNEQRAHMQPPVSLNGPRRASVPTSINTMAFTSPKRQPNRGTNLTFGIAGLSTPGIRAGEQRGAQRAFGTGATIRYSATSTKAVHNRQGEEAKAQNSKRPPYESSKALDQLVEDVKVALRTLTHPVVLITSSMAEEASINDTQPSIESFRGVTVSSFNTVTLSPEAVVSFNLRVPSRSWDAIKSSGRMIIHFLGANPEGAAMAHAFTQPYEHPSEPFQRLQGLGVIIMPPEQDSAKHPPPRLSWDGAMIAQIEAELLEDKHVQVGDHVIVFARVVRVVLPWAAETGDNKAADQNDGLAYAMRGFRGLGPTIEPIGLPKLKDATAGLSEYVMEEIEQHASSPAAEVPGDHPNYVEPHPDKLQAGHSNTVHAEQILADINREADHDLNVDEVKPEDLKGSGNEIWAATSERQNIAGESSNKLQVEIDQAIQVTASSKASENHPFGQSKDGGNRPGRSQARGSTPAAKATFSSLATSQQHSYTFVPFEKESRMKEGNDSQQSSSPSPITLVSDPAILSSTVGDFLGIYVDNEPVLRMRGLMRAQWLAKRASRELQAALEDGTLTPEKSAELEDIVTYNERHIAKKLALRSAQDLQRMLDHGKVDFRRAQWMESSIEKGQAVLLEEAKKLRRLLDEKAIDPQQFQLAKETLERDNNLLSTEAMRLRMMVDEDREGGEGAEGLTEGNAEFDGFKGNL